MEMKKLEKLVLLTIGMLCHGGLFFTAQQKLTIPGMLHNLKMQE
jgi:hypothetical protein